MQNVFRALRHRNYRLFFTGQTISLIGTWMQSVAVAWLVYRLTHSPLYLGLVGFAGQIPVFFLSPFTGVLADRLDRRKLLILSQTLATLQALLLYVLVITRLITVWQIILLSLLLGLINGLDMPVRQSFVVELIDKPEELSNAIALNSSIINGARLIGPSLAGILIAWLGEAPCFALNALSFIPILLGLFLMRLKPQQHERSGQHIFKDIRDGISYVLHFSPILTILLFISAMSMFGMIYPVFMPVFAKDILHGGAQTQGWLMAAAGVGALGGAYYLAARKNVLGLSRIIVIAASLFGFSLILFAFCVIFWLSLLLLVLVGLGMIIIIASSNTLLQTLVEDNKRGRVMSLYSMAFMGMTPIGSLLAGWAAHFFGVQYTLAACGTLCLLAASLFFYNLPKFRAQIRPVYIKKGILKEVATAIQTASELTKPPRD